MSNHQHLPHKLGRTKLIRTTCGFTVPQLNFATPAAEAVVDVETGKLEKLLDITAAQETRVNARDLHSYLESGWKFADWFQTRTKECDLIDGEDFGVILEFQNNPNGGRPAKNYWFTLDAASEVSMVERNAKGKQARRFFIACAKRLRNIPTAPVFRLPTTFAEALRLAADATEENEQLKLENSQLGADLTVKEEQVEFLEKTVEAVKTSEERTVDLLMARMDVSDKAITPTKFFKQTASVMGYSSDEGFAYLVDAKIFSKPVKNDWGTNQYEPMAPYDKCGYFQPAYHTNHRSTYDEEGNKTDVVRKEKLVTYHITADRLDKEGNITKVGGFRWLLTKMMKSWRTLLNRMIAETGGPGGEFRKLAGAVTRRVADSQIPCVDFYTEFCVIISKLPSGGVACAHKTKAGRVVRSEGVTQRDAFVKLNAQL